MFKDQHHSSCFICVKTAVFKNAKHIYVSSLTKLLLFGRCQRTMTITIVLEQKYLCCNTFWGGGLRLGVDCPTPLN